MNWTELADLISRMRRATAVLCVMLLAFAVSTSAWYFARSSDFSGFTDVIGYPLFRNFNNYKLLHAYTAGVVVALASLVLLERLQATTRWRGLPIFNAMHLAYAGVLGTMLAMIAPLGVVESAILSYLVLFACRALVVLCAPSGDQLEQAKTWQTALMLVGLPGVVHVIARATGWNDSAGFVRLNWFPARLALVASILAIAWLVWRRRAGVSNQEIERRITGFALVPLLMFLVFASVHGIYGTGGDFFHMGEKLAPLAIALKGGLPWRDFLFVHGIWDDFLKYSIGTKLWEPTLRAALTSDYLLFAPLYWASFYLALTVVLKGNILAALFGTVFGLVLNPDPFRFPLFPFVVLALFRWFESTRLPWAIVFAVLTSVQVFLTPEFGLLSVALGAGVLLRDLLDPGVGLRRFRGTLACAAAAVAVVVLLMIGLRALGLLDGFLVTILHFARGHLVTGGLPIQPVPNLLALISIVMAFVFLTVSLAYAEFRRSRNLSPFTLLGLSLAACTGLYAMKYIGRPDGHIHHVVVVAELGISLLAARLVSDAIQRTAARWSFNAGQWASSLAYVLAIGWVACLGIPGLPSENQAAQWWQRFVSPRAHLNGPSNSLLGGDLWAPGMQTTNSADRVRLIRQYLAHRVTVDEPVFDFSDSPVLSSAILGFKPASRFVHVSMAIRAETQHLVIDDLRRTKPRYVMYLAEGGLNGWDGIASDIRHHLVAAYINRNYVFDARVAGVTFFRRRDVDPPSDPAAYRKSDGPPDALSVCDLGFIPNFFRLDRQLSEARWTEIPLDATRPARIELAGWAAHAEGQARARLVVVRDGERVKSIVPDGVRADVDKAHGRQFGPTGYSEQFIAPAAGVGAPEVKVMIEDPKTGKLSSLGEQGWIGSVDKLVVTTLFPFRMPTSSTGHYLKMDFRPEPESRDETVTIWGSDPKHGKIEFVRRHDVQSVVLPVGGCHVWSRIGNGDLYLGVPSSSVRSIQFIEDPRSHP